jgi:septum site-determining protein MinD
LLGVVVVEPAVIVAANRGEAVALDPASQTGAAYRDIAARVAGEDAPAPSMRTEEGVFARLGALLRRRR